MANLSIIWLLLITAMTCAVYIVCRMFLRGSRKRFTFLALLASVYIYSGIGIAYETVDKINALYYAIFIAVMGLSYCLFTNIRIKSLAAEGIPRLIDDKYLWSSKTTKLIFVSLMVVYLGLRFVGLVYPVNHLANIKIVYDSSNNVNSLVARDVSAFATLAAILTPFFYIGMYYACRKVRYIALFMSMDAFVTLLTSGYLSRHVIITIAIVCFLLYINGDISKRPISTSKKSMRFIIMGVILAPVLVNVMLELMSVRVSSGESYTFEQMLESEIGYPLLYKKIHALSPIAEVKDFFLQMLDSFVPILPTPGYEMDLNVTFSKLLLGVDIKSPEFYVKLPGLLGESFLIFGDFYWVHAIVIAFLTALVYKVVGENEHMSVLWYYYITCIFKVGRAGYEQLTQSVLLNYVIIFVVLLATRVLVGSRRQIYGDQNR